MSELSKFNIPVILFIFKRSETTIKTIQILKKINARKIILVGDYGRNNEENKIVEKVRKEVLSAIDWDCDVEKRFATKNEGVFNQIGLGACDILKKEGKAIFLEDDNLPEESFFPYCEYLLDKYENEEKILWICGTNYLGQYTPKNGASYMFTKQLLPCGWASWGKKFNKYYDKTLEFLDDKKEIKKLRNQYVNCRLYKQQVYDAKNERMRFLEGRQFASWDYHMIMSVVKNNLYGIAPSCNLIKNTGVDTFATHGGVSKKNVMAQRFCGMDSFEISLPLKDPKELKIDSKFEKKISSIRVKPFLKTINSKIKNLIKKNIFHLNENESFKQKFLKK
jgi:hypothetical protein